MVEDNAGGGRGKMKDLNRTHLTTSFSLTRMKIIAHFAPIGAEEI